MLPLVFLDLDGTVIGSSGGVDACVWQAVDEAKAQGVTLAVCTGRPCMGIAQQVAARLGADNPHIFQSGAVLCYPDTRPLETANLPQEPLRDLLHYARAEQLTLELYSAGQFFVEELSAVGKAHAAMLNVQPEVQDFEVLLEQNLPIVRAQWVVDEAQLARALAWQHPSLQCSDALSPAMPGVHFVSITRQGVSKGSAAQRLAQFLDIELQQAMGVGDSEGDVPMLEVVGHPRLMGQAEARLQGRFPSVPEVAACGVAEALRQACYELS